MKILFIHPNMPGQYKHLARIMAQDPKNQVVFITKDKANCDPIPGITRVNYRVTRDAKPETHRYLINFERAIFQGQEVWRVCHKLKKQGFTPDVICVHPGWGDGMFLRDIYPSAGILSFLEFYYNTRGADVGFIPSDYTPGMRSEEYTPDDEARVRIKNACNLYNLEGCDWGITPTHWQLIQNPPLFHQKISVLHDGVDTRRVTPGDGNDSITINGVTLTAKDEVVTHIARNFEPYRGFPTVMRAIKEIQKRRPNCHVVCVGADGVSYGKTPPNGKTYRRMMLEETQPDMNRLHFLGYLPYDEMVKVMRISSAHIYLSVPFVLSWSMLESMAAGCLLIGSNTPPVMEVIEHGRNGLIVDFFSHLEIADSVDKIFSHTDRMQEIRTAARQTILDRYDLEKLLPMHLGLIEDVANRRLPPPTAAEIAAYNPQPKHMFEGNSHA